MSKRLSSILGLSKEKESTVSAPGTSHSRQSSATASPHNSPTPASKLHKNRFTSNSDLEISIPSIPPLEPPPTFRETASGISPRASSRSATRNGTGDYPSSRESSRSRPQTPTLLTVPGTTSSTPSSPVSATGTSKLKKRSWIPGGRPDGHNFEDGDLHQRAWIAGLKEHITYSLTPLLTGEKVSELWDDNGDVLVHLFPETTNRGPSFRVSSLYFADSRCYSYLHQENVENTFSQLHLDESNFGPPIDTSFDHHGNAAVPTIRPPIDQVKTMYLPLGLQADYHDPTATPQGDDLELLVLYRNFFSFMAGGALISTPRQVSLFSIFMGIASILRRLEYGSADGSSFGEIPQTSFARYDDELRLGDVRSSREKTIEAVVLGENMKYWKLYSEGFTHTAGRYEDIKSIKSPKFAKISPITLNRLERASLDVEARIAVMRDKLIDFEFPSMFAGIANSQTATEAKSVRFKAWRLAFIDFRKFTLAQYRRRYGDWPPKASSKKNNFESSGFNRVLVQEMYNDFCDLYDMLANPREMTTRTIDMTSMKDAISDMTETIQHALRVMESEYDRSTPPIMPPIPFDTPLIPSFDQSFKGGDMIASQKGGLRLKANEINSLLLGSYNREFIKPSLFVQEFMAYERKLAVGATLDDIVDNRCGQWLFLYAVIQALPMTAVDARDVRYTEGCQHFLFAAPRGGRPWMKEDTTSSRSWYNVKSAGQIISLSTDVLDHQPEGVYRRSHCWLIANQWLQNANKLPHSERSDQNLVELVSASQYQPPLPLPVSLTPRHSPAPSPVIRPMTPSDGERSFLPKSSSRTNLQVDLEEVKAPTKTPRPASQYNPSITFDSILSDIPQTPEKKKKK